MNVRITKSAAEHLRDGYSFYEEQEPGAGAYFYERLFAEIDELITTAGIHSKRWGKYHRVVCKPHPYAIFYRVEGDMTSVMAVIDCRRNPAWIRRTLKNLED